MRSSRVAVVFVSRIERELLGSLNDMNVLAPLANIENLKRE